MRFFDVVKSEKTKNGSIVHTTDNGDGNHEKKVYDTIRAGMSWPTPTSPGYYIILGEEYRDTNRFEGVEKRRGKLILLAEHQTGSPFLDELLPPLTDDCALFCCDPIHCDLSEEHQNEASIFREWLYNKKIRHGDLEEAPFMEPKDFTLGVSLIREWIKEKLLELLKQSIAHQQLSRIASEDLANPPETKFYAVNGLRYVVSAFHKYRPSKPLRISRPYRPRRVLSPSRW